METSYDGLIAFHGHSCPGLAIGYRMSRAALDHLARSRAEDEEIVAIVENNACGVDALQCLSGCTFGKGNLIFRDYGKQVYTLYDRRSRTGVRVVFRPLNVPESAKRDKDKFTDWLLASPGEDVVALEEVQIDEPEPARIMESVMCELCGDNVMVGRTRHLDDKVVCIPCAKTSASKEH